MVVIGGSRSGFARTNAHRGGRAENAYIGSDGSLGHVDTVHIQADVAVRLIANSDHMTPLIIGRHGTGGHPRASRSIANKEPETVAAAAAIQVKLFTAVAIAFGHQSGVSRLRSAIDPGFQGKIRAQRRAKIHGDVGHATIVRSQ